MKECVEHCSAAFLDDSGEVIERDRWIFRERSRCLEDGVVVVAIGDNVLDPEIADGLDRADDEDVVEENENTTTTFQGNPWKR